MDIHESFMQDILENRYSLTPRLIYADWLDEYGDEYARLRAKFIRAQCTLSQGYNAQAQTDQQNLMSIARSTWLPPSTTIYFWRPKFKNGFVEFVERQPCSNLLTVLDKVPLTALHLTGDYRKVEDKYYLTQLFEHKYWSQISELELNISSFPLSLLRPLFRGKHKVSIRNPQFFSHDRLHRVLSIAKKFPSLRYFRVREQFRGRDDLYEVVTTHAVEEMIEQAGMIPLSSTWTPLD